MHFKSTCQRIAYLDLTSGQVRVRLTTAHMPHAGFAEDVFEAAMRAIEEVVEDGRRQRFTNIIGVDANAMFGPNLQMDCDNIIGNFRVGVRSNRGDTLVSWLHGMRLAAVTTMKQRTFEDTWTHELWSTND